MTMKGGAGISGTVSRRITRGTLPVALGRGRVTGGKATLTMHVLHRMTPGRYTVAMVVAVNTTTVLSLKSRPAGCRSHLAEKRTVCICRFFGQVRRPACFLVVGRD